MTAVETSKSVNPPIEIGHRGLGFNPPPSPTLCDSAMIHPMGFDRISILGVGLIGGSVGLACRRDASHSQIIGYSRNTQEIHRATERGAIHYGTINPVEAVTNADLVILCTPVGVFGKLIEAIAPTLKPGAIVTDVCSTKRTFARLAEKYPKIRFVGSHPMAGAEKHGIENAREDLLTGALCIVTPTISSDHASLQSIEGYWQSLKMRTVRMSAEVHDQLTSDISHLPHAIAAALVRIQSCESLQLAARGFLDTTRIAAGDPSLWQEILLENRENLRSGIVRMQKELQDLLEKLDSNDPSAIQQWLKAAADIRRSRS
jgi:prephenate dehydrogenase